MKRKIVLISIISIVGYSCNKLKNIPDRVSLENEVSLKLILNNIKQQNYLVEISNNSDLPVVFNVSDVYNKYLFNLRLYNMEMKEIKSNVSVARVPIKSLLNNKSNYRFIKQHKKYKLKLNYKEYSDTDTVHALSNGEQYYAVITYENKYNKSMCESDYCNMSWKGVMTDTIRFIY